MVTQAAASNQGAAPVDPGGGTSLMLNLMAAQNPAAFAREDLRVWRDLVSPQEYTRFQALQQGVLSYPPSNEATAITQVPPEIRRNLKPEVLAALTRQAAANLRPVPVDPGGRASASSGPRRAGPPYGGAS